MQVTEQAQRNGAICSTLPAPGRELRAVPLAMCWEASIQILPEMSYFKQKRRYLDKNT